MVQKLPTTKTWMPKVRQMANLQDQNHLNLCWCLCPWTWNEITRTKQQYNFASFRPTFTYVRESPRTKCNWHTWALRALHSPVWPLTRVVLVKYKQEQCAACATLFWLCVFCGFRRRREWEKFHWIINIYIFFYRIKILTWPPAAKEMRDYHKAQSLEKLFNRRQVSWQN